MHDKSTDDLAKIIWNYMQLHETPRKSDGIFCLGSHDVRVAERAAELFLAGLANYIIFSGGLGRLTQNVFEETESEKFAKIAMGLGVTADKIYIENKSTNTGENVVFSFNLIKSQSLPAESLILVQKPYMERRTFATFKKKWPDASTKLTVTSPQLSFDEYVDGNINKDDVINIMVGDLQRIKEYPKLGFQIEQIIPTLIWDAYNELVARGYNKQLIQK